MTRSEAVEVAKRKRYLFGNQVALEWIKMYKFMLDGDQWTEKQIEARKGRTPTRIVRLRDLVKP